MPDSKNLLTMLNLCESEVEKLFLLAAYEFIEGLVPQYNVLGYRIDFAIPDKMIAIEIDGHEYHKTKEQRTHDAQREREIKLTLPANWTVIRFTGSEIFNNSSRCVDEVLQFINKNLPRNKSRVQALDKSPEIDSQSSAGVTKAELSSNPHYWAAKALKLWDYNGTYPFDTSTINKDNYQEAIECYNNAIAIDPLNISWYYGKARICTALFFYAKDMHIQDEFDLYFNETLEMYKKAIKIDPSDVRFWMEIGEFFNQLEKYVEASNAFDKAIEVNQGEKWFHVSIWNGKIHALNGVAKTNPHDADMWYAIGNSWVKRGLDIGSIFSAIKAYDKAIINRPNFVEAWHSKGLALKQYSNGLWKTSIEAAFAMAQGKYDEAIKAYDEDIRRKPSAQ